MDEDELISQSNKTSEFLSNNESNSVENLSLIREFVKIDKCSILKYGIKPSIEEINYGYCVTCDINLIHPICLVCLEKCHKDIHHQIKIIEKPSNIICGCGERMHRFPKKVNPQDEELSRNCPYFNWCQTSQLTTWYMIGNRKLCIFCSMICEHNRKATPVEYETNEYIGEFCQCQELNSGVTHTDLKNIYKKIDEISKNDSEIMQILGPLKMINMMFMGRNTYDKLYYSFDEMLNEFKDNKISEIKDNFLSTNFFLGLKNFISICSQIKFSSISYFCNEISDRINFELIEKVIKNVSFKETRQYWLFISKLLYLFKKVSISCYTSCMDKYKIYDLENFYCIQRKCLFHNSLSFFPDAKKQINFFIEMLGNYLNIGINLQEGYEGIIEICAILKLFSKYYLFSSKEMILFCFEFERCSDLFKRIKDYNKQLRLYIIVIKILHFFVLSYNDEIFYKCANSPNGENKCNFIYTKNELGRLISRNVIRMMYFCSRAINSKDKLNMNDNQKKMSKKIIKHGIKILSYLILPNDSYTYSIYKSQTNVQFYFDIMNISNDDENYKIFLSEVSLIENTYKDFFTFSIDEDIMIDKIFNSLKRVMNFKISDYDRKLFLLKSNYFYCLIKLFYICEFDPSNEIDVTFLEGFFEFLEFFIEGNSDLAMIILSHYVMNAIMKVPAQFSYDIFKLFDYCADLIVEQNKFINFSKHILKTLFNYLLRFKRDNNENNKKSNENQVMENDSDADKVCSFDVLLNLFLNIVIKLSLRIKQPNQALSNKIVKKIIIKLLSNLTFVEITHDNLKYILAISNKIFDSSEANDRKELLNLIPFNELLNILSDLRIDVDFRMEILVFIQKNKFNLFFSRSPPCVLGEDGRYKSRKSTKVPTKMANNLISQIKTLANNANNNKDNMNDKSSATNPISKLSNKSIQKKSGNLNDQNNKNNSNNPNNNTLNFKYSQKKIEEYSIYPETKIKMDNDYLNAFGEYYDNFTGLTENPLISNFQYPTKFLTFYYNIIKVNTDSPDDDDSLGSSSRNATKRSKPGILNSNQILQSSVEIDEEAIIIFENELKRFKDIYMKNSSNLTKFMNYFCKGLIIPLTILIKKIFCNTHVCDGNKILTLYKIAMDILYIKNYLFELGNSFIQNIKDVKIDNFNMDCFFDRNSQIETLDDYFDMKECIKFSPFDYTKLYLIFEKHLFSFNYYPNSLELKNNFGSNNIEHLLENSNNDSLIFEESDDSGIPSRKVIDTIFNNNNANTLGMSMAAVKTNNKSHVVNIGKNKVQASMKVLNEQGTLKRNNSFPIDLSEDKKRKKKGNNKNKKKKNLEDSTDENCFENEVNNIIVEYLKIYQRKKNEIDEKKSSLFTSLSEMCMEYEKNFREMLIVILIKISSLEDQIFLSDCYMILYLLLSIETPESQNDIMDYLGGKFTNNLGFLIEFSDVLYEKIIKIFIGDFCIDNSYNELNQNIAFNVIKIFKFLCEEHNNFFQGKILSKLEYKFNKWDNYIVNITNRENFIVLHNDGEEEFQQASMTFFNFMINILQKILLITNKAKEELHINYLFDIVYCIVELLVEIIQGNKEEIINNKKNLSEEEINNNISSAETFKQFVQIVTEILFDNSLDTGRGFEVRLLLMSFFISILEEKTNEDAQKIIMKFLTLNRVLSSIIYTLKNYFYNHTQNDPKFQSYYKAYNDKKRLQREFVFDFTLYSYFEDIYFHTDFSKNSEEFDLANNYYKYIKLLSIGNKLPEASKIIKQVENLSLAESKKKFNLFNKNLLKPNEIAPINLINEKERIINIETIEHYYAIKFFEKITKIVEVRLVDEKRSQLVIFTVPSEIIYLSEMTKIEFEAYVDRDSEISKKNELLKNMPLFLKEIKYYKKRKVNCFVSFLTKLDYIYVQWFVYLYAVGFNILMIFTLQGYKGIEESSTITTRRLRRLKNVGVYLNNHLGYYFRKLIYILPKIEEAIDLSIDDWGVIYDTLAYLFVVLNGILICSWILVRFPLYYKLDIIKYIEANKMTKNQLTILNKIYIGLIMTIWGRDYINTLLFMFILSLTGAIMERGEIIYSFFLLAIVDLNPTLKNIVTAIKWRYSELGASFLLMVVLVFFYSNIGFFFFNNDYRAEIESSKPDDNYCYSLAFCFLTNIDAGIRARGGAADQMVRISFERNFTNYIMRLIFDVTYFLIVIIIMIELVFGIIIGTFSEMRSAEIKVEIDKENHCFICHVTRENAEKKNRDEDFSHHRNVSHYLWNYVEYMIFLKFSDLHDLNAANAYARTNMDKKNICFLPTYKDLLDDNDNEKAKKKIELDESKESNEDSDEFKEKDEEEENEDEENEDGSNDSSRSFTDEEDEKSDKGRDEKRRKKDKNNKQDESDESDDSEAGRMKRKNFMLLNRNQSMSKPQNLSPKNGEDNESDNSGENVMLARNKNHKKSLFQLKLLNQNK